MASLQKKLRRKHQKALKKEAHKNAVRDAKAKLATVFIMQEFENDLRVKAIGWMLTAWTYELNRGYGFGRKRLNKLFMRLIEFSDDYVRDDWSPVSEWEQALKEEAGFIFCRPEQKNVMRSERIMQEEIERMTVIFACVLFVDFGFRKKRLNHLYAAVRELSKDVDRGEYTWEEIDNVLTKKKIFVDKELLEAKHAKAKAKAA